MEMSGNLHAPATLILGKRTQYPIQRRLSGPHIRSGRGGEEEKKPFPDPAGNRTYLPSHYTD